MSVFNKNTMAVNVFVLKVFRFRLQILETAAALHALMVNSTCQGLFCTDEQCEGILCGSRMVYCWSCCCGSRAFPGDLAGISVAERSIGGKSVSLQAFTDDVIIIDLSVG